MRRRSKPAEWAASFCRRLVITSAALGRILKGIERYADRLTRRAHAGYGEVTPKVVRVFKELALMDLDAAGGLLTPSYRQIGYKARCCRATVARALDVLERHGFLVRLRRHRPARSGEPGRWEQDTNAYRLETPPAAERLVDAPHMGLDTRMVPPARPVRQRRPLPPPPPNLKAGAVILDLGERYAIAESEVLQALADCGLVESMASSRST